MPKEKDTQKHHVTASAPYKLGSRSCNGCYQRKVRCDRAVPCSYCESHGLVCRYPAKASESIVGDGSSTTTRTPNLQSISSRLARVEELLTRLLEERTEQGERPNNGDKRILQTSGGSMDPHQSMDQPRIEPQDQLQQRLPRTQRHQDEPPDQSTWEILLNDSHDDHNERPLPFSGLHSTGNTPKGGTAHRGYDAGVSSDRPPRFPFPHRTSPTSATPHDQPTTIHAGVSRPDTYNISDVHALYPSTQLALQLWSIYVKAVDPVLKILHIPTVQTTVVATILNPVSAAPSTLALTLAIYYAALTADPTVLPAAEIETQLSRCRAALDTLLTVTHLVARPDMSYLQALAIYVTCLRVHEAGRRVWVLNGLAIRLAQSMGLHRDGAHLRLAPFDTEMRLRLWWHLCVLDSRAPEDQGLQPTIAVANWELRLPRNVNDAQLYPGMAQLPPETVGGWTEMSFFLVQTEACRRMHPILETQGRQQTAAVMAAGAMQPGEPPASSSGATTKAGEIPLETSDLTSDALLTSICEKRNIIRDPARYMQARFGVSIDGLPSSDDVLARMAIQHMGTAVKKMEFVLQLREEIILQQRQRSGKSITTTTATTTTTTNDGPVRSNNEQPAILRPSFRLACDALDSSRALLDDSAVTPFGWLFGTYTQWYALAYVLRCLCCRPREIVAETQALAEHAWALVDELFPSVMRLRSQNSDGKEEGEGDDDGSIWSYLHRLRQQVAVVRDDQARFLATGDGADAVTQAESGVDFHQPSFVATESLSLGDRPPSMSFDGLLPSTDMDMDLFMTDIQFLPDWNTVINM